MRLTQPTVPQWLFVLGMIGIAVSVFLWYSALSIRVIGCLTGGCELVLSSPYSRVFGVPIAAYGVAYYAALLLIAFFRMFDESVIVRMTGWAISLSGIFFSAYFFYLEIFKINAICSWCKVSTVITVILFVMALQEIKKYGGITGLREQLMSLRVK